MFIKGWKRKTTLLGRLYCQLQPSVRPIDESDYGLWATITKHGNYNKKGASKNSGNGLATEVALWATPRASNAMNDKAEVVLKHVKKCGYKGKLEQAISIFGEAGFGPTAQMGSKGSLNPQFPCWLMGFPKGWLD